MADNIEITAGSGTIISTDDCTGGGGGHVQRMKLAYSADASFAHVTADADGLLVNLGANNDVAVTGAVTVSGTVTANAGTNLNTSALALEAGGNLAAAVTALQIVDDWDESDRAKVNPIVGQAGVAAGAGAVGATVQRMTLASDDPAVVALQVLDDWDENNRAAVNLIAGATGISAAAGAVAANTPRVTLGSDDPAVVSLAAIDDWDESDRCKVNLIDSQAGITGGAGAVAANTPRVTHASDDPAVTALQLIDDTVFADDAAFTPATSKVVAIGAMADETSPDSVNEGDVGVPRMTLDRKLYAVPVPHTGEGLSIFRSLDLDESEEEVKGSAGAVYGMWVTNTATSTRWLKFYNDTAANVVVGTTQPVITWGIPGNTSDDISGLFGGGHGIKFDTAITVAATTGVADNDTGAPGANDVIVNIFYK